MELNHIEVGLAQVTELLLRLIIEFASDGFFQVIDAFLGPIVCLSRVDESLIAILEVKYN